jgi:FtsZ-interacting cell division protein YlmF
LLQFLVEKKKEEERRREQQRKEDAKKKEEDEKHKKKDEKKEDKKDKEKKEKKGLLSVLGGRSDDKLDEKVAPSPRKDADKRVVCRLRFFSSSSFLLSLFLSFLILIMVMFLSIDYGRF